jgi:iron complex transport system substrate-binding protein
MDGVRVHRKILTAFAAVAALVLVACGGAPSDSSGTSGTSGKQASGDSAAPVTVTHAMGTTEIEGTPERIVALD